MKILRRFFLPGVVALLASCVSRPLVLEPVGPSPSTADASRGGTGRLQVFSSLVEEHDDQNQGSSGADPGWQQHSDYDVYDAYGKHVRHVGNAVGHYASRPRSVLLPSGRYTVRAEASDWLCVEVPIVIERDRTTTVHLDDHWEPPPGTPKSQVATAPNGIPIGYRSSLVSRR